MAETSDMATLVTGDTGGVAGSGSSLHWTDWLVIVGYFLSVIAVSKRFTNILSILIECFRSGLCHHLKVKEIQWTGIFWQAGA